MIGGRRFSKLIDEVRITEAVNGLARQLSEDLTDEEDVLFLGVLNGAFLFAADLFRQITVSARISFVKLASYEGTESTGRVKELIGWSENVEGKSVVVVEDIVDSGRTLEMVVGSLALRRAASVKVVTLLFKPESFRGMSRPDYAAFVIPPGFVAGYGLDYNGYGRNLPEIYTLIE